MSLRTLSQNKFSNKRYNSSNTIFSNYWLTLASGSYPLTAHSGGYKHVGIDQTGATYITGVTLLGTGSQDIFLFKYDTSGNLVWQRTLGSSGFTEYGCALTVDQSNNIYVVGQYSNNTTYIAKYNSNGNLLFQVKHSGVSNFTAMDIALDSSGNIFVTGYITTTATWAFLVAFDSSGNYITQNRQGGGATATAQYGYGVVTDQSGYIYTIGYYSSSIVSFVTKWSLSGTLSIVWSKTFSPMTFGISIAVDSLGYIYAYGITGTTSATTRPLLVKIDNSGSVIWTRQITQAYTSSFNICIDYLNNIYLTAVNTNTVNDPYIFKYDSSGNLLWQRTLYTSTNDTPNGIISDSFGNFYVSLTDTTNNTKVANFHLPADGSLTGTYGTYTYDVSSLTSSTGISTTVGTCPAATGSATVTTTTPTLISQSVSHSSSLTPITY